MRTILGRDEAGRVISIAVAGDTGAIEAGEAAAPHDHDADYAALTHEHDAAAEHPDLAAHTTLGLSASHSHDFAASGHTHDTSHDHDQSYSATGHIHDLENHSHLDADLPAGLARDAEVTSAIATHAETPHGGEGGGVTLAEVIDALYPVGHQIMEKTGTNPGTRLTGTTWVQVAEGRYIVGQTGAQAGGDEIGSATHSHAFTHPDDHTDVVNHTHPVNVTDPQHAHVQGVNSATTGGTSGYTPDTSTNTRANSGYSTSNAATGITAATTNPAGGVAALAHAGGAVADGSTSPLGFVAYIWERTA